MSLHYTLTAIPRDNPKVRSTKMQRVLPELREVDNMCRQEIALVDLHPYFDKIERGFVWKGYRWAFEGTPLKMN